MCILIHPLLHFIYVPYVSENITFFLENVCLVLMSPMDYTAFMTSKFHDCQIQVFNIIPLLLIVNIEII